MKAEKLSRLPDNIKLEKRPLIRGPIASPYAGKQHSKIVYISRKTQFMSAFKRIKQLLKHIEKRETQVELSHARRNNRKGAQSSTFRAQKDDAPEPVFVRATGKAIDKALQLGLFLQQQRDLKVAMKTESADAIDDVVVKQDVGTDALARLSALSSPEDLKGSTHMDEDCAEPATGHDASNQEDFLKPRIRHVSVLQIEVTLR